MIVRLAWLKRLASMLLLVCLVLPLSKCESKKEVAGVTQVQVSYLYGYQMARDGVGDVAKGKLDAVPGLLFLIIVFCVPALSLLLKEGWQSLVQLCAAFPAMFALYGWTLLGRTPQIGGILAAECWLFLFASSASLLWFRWFSKRKLRAAEPA